MKILLIGSGGREHALAWKIRQSPRCDKLYCAPGNAGIAAFADCIDITADNIEGLAAFASKEMIDLTVVGPEGPLCAGIVDHFHDKKLRIFGPSKAAAEIEGSKVFCKELLRRNGIPTSSFRVFTNFKQAAAHVKTAPFPLVVKADGLAAGKGVVIAHNGDEAIAALDNMMMKKQFGRAGERVVIEEFLNGVEASILSFTDGKSIVTLDSVQDHKRVYDGDRGPNTGGMGAFSPAPVASEADQERVIREVLVPIVHALNKEKRRFQGLLYAGVMFTRSGPKVLEFNARFGDPECQPLLARMRNDLVPVLLATADGRLDEVVIDWDPRPAVCVVIASGGYPGSYETGYPISGLEEAAKQPDVVVFHAGTTRKDGKIVTAGGRVLGVTALGETLAVAQAKAYASAKLIDFTGIHYRKDIGAKSIKP